MEGTALLSDILYGLHLHSHTIKKLQSEKA